MKRRILQFVVAGTLLAPGTMIAQAVRLEVRAMEGAADSRVPEIVRKATRTDSLAPKLRLEAKLAGSGEVPLSATVEWFVFGRTTAEARQAGRAAAPAWTVMQHSKEVVTVKPTTGARTSFFAYAPGQVRNGARSEGWLVRLLGGDGRVIDAKASSANFLPLARDFARLDALLRTKPADAQNAGSDPELPLEVIARIKAEAEKNWPGNPEMQAIEIKNKTDYHKSAYKK